MTKSLAVLLLLGPLAMGQEFTVNVKVPPTPAPTPTPTPTPTPNTGFVVNVKPAVVSPVAPTTDVVMPPKWAPTVLRAPDRIEVYGYLKDGTRVGHYLAGNAVETQVAAAVKDMERFLKVHYANPALTEAYGVEVPVVPFGQPPAEGSPPASLRSPSTSVGGHYSPNRNAIRTTRTTSATTAGRVSTSSRAGTGTGLIRIGARGAGILGGTNCTSFG